MSISSPTFSSSLSANSTLPLAIMKSSEASTEVEILNTLQKTVADPKRPFDRSIVTVTLVDSVTVIGLIDFKPNSPLALSLFRTER